MQKAKSEKGRKKQYQASCPAVGAGDIQIAMHDASRSKADHAHPANNLMNRKGGDKSNTHLTIFTKFTIQFHYRGSGH